MELDARESSYPFSRLEELAGDLELPGLDFDQRAEWLRGYLSGEVQRRRREAGHAWDVLDATLAEREGRSRRSPG